MFLPLALLFGCGEDKRLSGDEDGVNIDDSTSDGGGDPSAWLDADPGNGDDAGDCDDQSSTNPTYEYDFSIIWIANTPEGTVSKIDTMQAQEVARYRTGPISTDDSPSRTSVNLRGDVVVANRGSQPVLGRPPGNTPSSFTMIRGRSENCADQDGDGTVRTSMALDDVLEWGDDECVVWHYVAEEASPAAGGYGGARGAAWDAGDPKDLNDCEDVRKPSFWGGYMHSAHIPDFGMQGAVYVDRLNGETGEREARAIVEDERVITSTWGVYGAAADKDGNYWGLVGNDPQSFFFFIERESLAVEVFATPGWAYGFALDEQGRPWSHVQNTGQVVRVDRVAGAIDTFPGGGMAHTRGAVIDREGHLWSVVDTGTPGLSRFDTRSESWVNPSIAIAEARTPVGVSVDVEGHVWVVDQVASAAFKLLPTDNGVELVDTVDTLNGPYTYSDMTGAGLRLVADPPIL